MTSLATGGKELASPKDALSFENMPGTECCQREEECRENAQLNEQSFLENRTLEPVNRAGPDRSCALARHLLASQAGLYRALLEPAARLLEARRESLVEALDARF